MSTSSSTDLSERVTRVRADLRSSAEGRETLSNLSATGSVEADQLIRANWTQGWGQGWPQYAGYDGEPAEDALSLI
jgi:hypothetical protein